MIDRKNKKTTKHTWEHRDGEGTLYVKFRGQIMTEKEMKKILRDENIIIDNDLKTFLQTETSNTFNKDNTSHMNKLEQTQKRNAFLGILVNQGESFIHSYQLENELSLKGSQIRDIVRFWRRTGRLIESGRQGYRLTNSAVCQNFPLRMRAQSMLRTIGYERIDRKSLRRIGQLRNELRRKEHEIAYLREQLAFAKKKSLM